MSQRQKNVSFSYDVADEFVARSSLHGRDVTTNLVAALMFTWLDYCNALLAEDYLIRICVQYWSAFSCRV